MIAGEPSVGNTSLAAAGRAWDALVVGSGPAGAAAAIALAQKGRSVLLVDKAAFPRDKVCGCCLNRSALDSLQRLGLEIVSTFAQAPRLAELLLAAGGRQARVALPGGVAVSRATLDTALARHAARAGVAVLTQVRASLTPLTGTKPEYREVQLVDAQGAAAAARARVVIAADGLGGRLLDAEQGCAATVIEGSRIGVGAIVPADQVVTDPPGFYGPGRVYMACGPGGYVGQVVLEDGRLDIAAALDPEAARTAGGPGPLASAILCRAGLPVPTDLAALHWRGTPRLTRRRSPAAERVLVVGDAAGYVEPFTGEGIAWALASGEAAADWAATALANGWSPAIASGWRRDHARLLRGRGRICGWIASGLRRPTLTSAAVAVLSRLPALAGPLAMRIGAADRRGALHGGRRGDGSPAPGLLPLS